MVRNEVFNFPAATFEAGKPERSSMLPQDLGSRPGGTAELAELSPGRSPTGANLFRMF
jgi:hypothetical protein